VFQHAGGGVGCTHRATAILPGDAVAAGQYLRARWRNTSAASSCWQASSETAAATWRASFHDRPALAALIRQQMDIAARIQALDVAADAGSSRSGPKSAIADARRAVGRVDDLSAPAGRPGRRRSPARRRGIPRARPARLHDDRVTMRQEATRALHEGSLADVGEANPYAGRSLVLAKL
jgi:hypothetical protein